MAETLRQQTAAASGDDSTAASPNPATVGATPKRVCDPIGRGSANSTPGIDASSRNTRARTTDQVPQSRVGMGDIQLPVRKLARSPLRQPRTGMDAVGGGRSGYHRSPARRWTRWRDRRKGTGTQPAPLVRFSAARRKRNPSHSENGDLENGLDAWRRLTKRYGRSATTTIPKASPARDGLGRSPSRHHVAEV